MPDQAQGVASASQPLSLMRKIISLEDRITSEELKVARLEMVIGEQAEALRECLEVMGWATVFVLTRERVREPEGRELWEQARRDVEAALAGSHAKAGKQETGSDHRG